MLASLLPDKRALQPFGEWRPRGATAGVAVSEETALTLSAVWACQTLIADAIATKPQDTYRRSGKNRIETTPPAWLSAPNPWSTQTDFDTQRILSLLGWGESVCVLIRANGDETGPVLERWPVHPSRVEVRDRVVHIDHKPVRSGDVQRIVGYRQPGAERGMSPIRFANQMIALGLAAEKYDAQFFANGAVTTGALEVPELPVDASAATVERLREQFAERHASVENMHKPIVLTGGTKWTQTSVNPEDAQLLETRQFQVNEVARWYRVPPHMIGDVERDTSWGAGIEYQGINFVQHTLLPWVCRLEEADSALLPRGQFVRRNMNALLRGDSAARREWYRAGVDAGWLLRSEVRAFEELPPIEGIDDQPDPGPPPEGGDDGFE